MENVRIYQYKNHNKSKEVEDLNSVLDRLIYYIIDNLDFLFMILVYSQIMSIGVSIFEFDFNIFNALILYFESSIVFYIAFFIALHLIDIISPFKRVLSNTFKLRYIFKIGLKKYINKLINKEVEQEQSFYKRRYDLLFFKKENDEIKVKHLVDFIDNNEFTLKGNKLTINDDYHLVNDDNIKKYISSHQDEIDIFKQSINQYYLDGLKIQPYIEQAQFLVDYNGHDEELALKNRLDHFKKNLNIKKES